MFSHTTVPYRNATKIANHVMMLILRSVDEKGCAMLVREWVALEFAKREWRGAPRLSTHSIKEASQRRTRLRRNPRRAIEGIYYFTDRPHTAGTGWPIGPGD